MKSNLLKGMVGFIAAGLALRVLIRAKRRVSLEGSVILITGGSRGLGLILARKFAEQGALLALCARNLRELESARVDLLKRGARKVFIKTCDVGDPVQAGEMVHSVVEEFGRIDVLVNNASIISVGPAELMSEADFHQALQVNFWGTVQITAATLPFMLDATQHGYKDQRIVNISSIGGAVAVPHLLPYVSAKFAVSGFSQGLRAELARYGIRVVTVLPGLMRTGSFVNALFKGKREQEFSWFSLGATLPIVSMDAERAADRIIRACKAGEAFVTIGLPAKVLRLFQGLFPSAMAESLALVNRFLPKVPHPNQVGSGLDDERQQNAEPGWMHPTRLTKSWLTELGSSAAEKFNET